MLNQTGIPTLEQVLSRFPNKDALLRPKAILECYEDIPCNPCETSCPFDAITIGENINTQPVLNVDKCTGCGICVQACPGLAIVVAHIKDQQAIFKIPYEFLPIPSKGDLYEGVNRKGEVICDAVIESVLLTKKQDHTMMLTVSVPKDHLYDFVTIGKKR